jgi:predicted acylesterase/phospholipase RssA
MSRPALRTRRDNRRAVPETPALSLLRSSQEIGYLFSGGAVRTIFQVGVVETLDILGIRPAACLGVSAGAWNAAAVAVGNLHRLRPYWRFFVRMPAIDVTNLLREHSPFVWSRIHERAFNRYVGTERIKAAETLPLLVALTRLRDKQQVIFDVRDVPDPFRVLLASNYLPPFYTHPLDIEGEHYGDGGWTNSIPYEDLFDRGCDAVVLMASKGESEGGLYRHPDDYEHEIAPQYRDRVVVIRPRHRMPLNFVERRWSKLSTIADLGALRAREVLLGERHPQTDLAATGKAFSAHLVVVRDLARKAAVWRRRASQPESRS